MPTRSWFEFKTEGPHQKTPSPTPRQTPPPQREYKPASGGADEQYSTDTPVWSDSQVKTPLLRECPRNSPEYGLSHRSNNILDCRQTASQGVIRGASLGSNPEAAIILPPHPYSPPPRLPLSSSATFCNPPTPGKWVAEGLVWCSLDNLTPRTPPRTTNPSFPLPVLVLEPGQISVPSKVAKLYLCHFVCCISRSKIMYDSLTRLVA